MAKVYRYTDRETGEKEPLDSLIKRFNKRVTNDNIIQTYKKHTYFRPKAIKRKEKSIEALKRSKKKNKNR